MSDRQSLRDRLQRKAIEVPRDRLRSRASEPGISNTEQLTTRRANRNIEYHAIKGDLHERLIDELNRQGALARGDSELKPLINEFVADVLETEDWPLNEDERGRLASDLLEETLGTGPLAPLMADPAVTDILVNRYDHVYVERFGILEETDVRFRDDEHLVRIIGRIASRVGRRIDTSSPMVDARLPDGSRVNATLPPVTIDGPTLSIRRFGRRRLTRVDLLRLGMLSDVMDRFLEALIRHRKSIIVTGGTGSGKSTLLGAIAEAIPDRERIITIEDAAELMLSQTHVIRMETRAPNTEGKGAITQRDLVVNALRMRPDRIVMGEVRAGEALDMLQAMNTGHDGSLTTIHANSPRDAFARLETMVMMAGMDLPSQSIREHAVSAVNYLVHVRRYEDGVRRVERIAEVVGIEGKTPQLQDIFTFQPTGRSENRIEGRFQATGVVPRIVDELASRGISEVDRNWFGREA
ncbi:CpaF family protein [Roseiconus nitratireducens]|uniref:CpaF family protein n=1 Tax=Roseiconus nitratireducens TaxID=2605748 RepID=A0A5M6DEA4_9BACT|nr:CpaF family protein [Roseiconus nitratireducens]KAA5545881.1 CpaF family protein [Roseiconus nitratireducens]